MAVFTTEEESLKQYKRLRRDVGADESVFGDELAEEYFEESLEFYPSSTAKMIAYARVIALRGIRASSALLGKYARNQAEDDLTKVFDNLSVMLKDAESDVEDAVDIVDAATLQPFFFGTAPGRRGY